MIGTRRARRDAGYRDSDQTPCEVDLTAASPTSNPRRSASAEGRAAGALGGRRSSRLGNKDQDGKRGRSASPGGAKPKSNRVAPKTEPVQRKRGGDGHTIGGPPARRRKSEASLSKSLFPSAMPGVGAPPGNHPDDAIPEGQTIRRSSRVAGVVVPVLPLQKTPAAFHAAIRDRRSSCASAKSSGKPPLSGGLRQIICLWGPGQFFGPSSGH